ncbi:hypothetical protein AAFF_G00396540 [Aldrovandia affinis]|uniref:Uncharacterized protein n=1 Tax=Aldrovandia affinis TaxID=143900 RepID=A0AAD7WKZ2_9TELE|nr:hypothetical protein AAFF_G00396540 [Aldrovandia affinis]
MSTRSQRRGSGGRAGDPSPPGQNPLPPASDPRAVPSLSPHNPSPNEKSRLHPAVQRGRSHAGATDAVSVVIVEAESLQVRRERVISGVAVLVLLPVCPIALCPHILPWCLRTLATPARIAQVPSLALFSQAALSGAEARGGAAALDFLALLVGASVGLPALRERASHCVRSARAKSLRAEQSHRIKRFTVHRGWLPAGKAAGRERRLGPVAAGLSAR